MTRPAATAAETEFHDRMHAAHMYGLWELASQMTKHPEPKAIPYMWKASLIESVKRVALVAERNTAVQLAFSDGVLTLDAGSGDEAQASESIEATIEGEDITTGFNPQFLLDGLTAIEEPVVELAFTQASKPVVISGTSGDGVAGDASGFRYLLMPRRLLS